MVNNGFLGKFFKQVIEIPLGFGFFLLSYDWVFLHLKSIKNISCILNLKRFIRPVNFYLEKLSMLKRIIVL